MQTREVADHMASAVKNQRMTNYCTQLGFSLSMRSKTQEQGIGDSPTIVNLINVIPHRHDQRLTQSI